VDYDQRKSEEDYACVELLLASSSKLSGVKLANGFCLMFKPTPKIFHGIKFRSVGWKEKGLKASRLPEKIENLFSSMRQKAVPNNEGGSLELPVQLVKETPYMRGIEVVVWQDAEIKPYTFSFQNAFSSLFLSLASSFGGRPEGGTASMPFCPSFL